MVATPDFTRLPILTHLWMTALCIVHLLSTHCVQHICRQRGDKMCKVNWMIAIAKEGVQRWTAMWCGPIPTLFRHSFPTLSKVCTLESFLICWFVVNSNHNHIVCSCFFLALTLCTCNCGNVWSWKLKKVVDSVLLINICIHSLLGSKQVTSNNVLECVK